MKRIITVLASMLCLCMVSQAKLALSSVCSDGMVLQQNTEARIWGTSDAGVQVTVTPSWNGKAYRCNAGSDGRWSVKVETPAGSYKAYSISVKGDGTVLKINDVLVGEVWLASGQSNMQMPLSGFFNCPVENAMEYICAPAAREKIRMFNVPTIQSYEPLENVDAVWKGADYDSRRWMSAVAYFFAMELNQMLDIPVGIVSCAYGGARIESWLPKEILETYPDEDLSRETIEAMTHYHRPYLMYNAMLNPVMGYTIKGFIWYQGCSNVGKHDQFCDRMTTLVNHWRECWEDSEAKLPFYMVELAPYRNKPYTATPYFALLRQAQHETAHSIPNCALAVTNDLVESYEQDNIHPAKKKEVGDRLAWLALNRDYGHGALPCYSPEAVRCVSMAGGTEIGVELTHCDNGLDRWMEIEGLEVAGSEGIFYPVTYAYFEWDQRILRIRSEFVHDPCEVRYGWGDYKPGNLKNTEGLPVSPFYIKLEN
jgi:sialate O-acetylesterase